MAFYRLKKSKLWIIKALDRTSRRVVGWILGRRSSTTFQKLYDQVSHLTDCKFYTDDWEAFRRVLPADRHVVGKAGTIAIEQNNSNTRHHLARMTRRTKVVSKTEEMVDMTLKLWCALTDPEIFNQYQKLALSSFM